MSNPYETRRYLDEYLLFHYGEPKDLCPYSFVDRNLLNFHERIRKECILPVRRKSGAAAIRALDVGCAVGRFTFELGRVADEALGIDNSHSFIHAARVIAKSTSTIVQVTESGAKTTKIRVSISQPLRSSRVSFQVGDALDVAASVKHPRSFDLVTAINLLCRLPAPRRFLSQLPNLVAPGGQFIIGSPFSWLEEYTPKSRWLTPADLEKSLRPHFRLKRQRDLPFMIREHRRKYQLVISNVLTFVRIGG